MRTKDTDHRAAPQSSRNLHILTQYPLCVTSNKQQVHGCVSIQSSLTTWFMPAMWHTSGSYLLHLESYTALFPSLFPVAFKSLVTFWCSNYSATREIADLSTVASSRPWFAFHLIFVTDWNQSNQTQKKNRVKVQPDNRRYGRISKRESIFQLEGLKNEE